MMLKSHNFELYANNMSRVIDMFDLESDNSLFRVIEVLDFESDIVTESSNLVFVFDSKDQFINEFIDHEYKRDFMSNKILTLFRNDTRHNKKIILIECEDRNERLYYKKK